MWMPFTTAGSAWREIAGYGRNFSFSSASPLPAGRLLGVGQKKRGSGARKCRRAAHLHHRGLPRKGRHHDELLREAHVFDMLLAVLALAQCEALDSTKRAAQQVVRCSHHPTQTSARDAQRRAGSARLRERVARGCATVAIGRSHLQPEYRCCPPASTHLCIRRDAGAASGHRPQGAYQRGVHTCCAPVRGPWSRCGAEHAMGPGIPLPFLKRRGKMPLLVLPSTANTLWQVPAGARWG